MDVIHTRTATRGQAEPVAGALRTRLKGAPGRKAGSGIRRRNHPRRARRGSELFSGLLWFGIVVLAIAAIVTLYIGGTNTLKRTNLTRQLTQAVAIIERAHIQSGIYQNRSLLVFLSDEGFSERELTKESSGAYTFTSPFDTAITIRGNGGRDFVVTIENLPPAACRAAVLAFQDPGSGLESVTVGGTHVGPPISEVFVANRCNTVSGDYTVALTF
ncbi:hypothetical protein [Ruegeria atlantica]|uniref:hypothetical protein n=1 Tax=Ruegeria atlantica TaxID=81569 RepID=UPI00147C3501|nr:hypothetical protein [Ruegeria atlantica]